MKVIISIWLFSFQIIAVNSIEKITNTKTNNTFESRSAEIILIQRPNKSRSHYEIDYKTLYNLRFDPISLYRATTRNSKENESNFDISTTTQIAAVSEPSDFLQYSLVHENGDKFVNNSMTNSNVMRPQEGKSTLSFLGSRIKEILFGTTVPMKKSPVTGKGLLNLFDVIQFENVQCTANIKGIRFLNGTCYHHFECITQGGVPMGSCANGYGVCCIFKYGCGELTRQTITYFESPKFPLPKSEPYTCIFTVKIAHDVKQVRLDFPFFELRRPIEGDCVEDQFIISGQTSNFKIPVLCGVNTGQHIYVDVHNSPERKLFISVFGRVRGNRAFSIKVTQLRKDDLAPENCLQYFTEQYGYIKSFNYEEVSNMVENQKGSYLNNLNYAICIKRAPDKCFVSYSNVFGGDEFPFQLINLDEEGISLVPAGQAGVTIYNCPDDFILINAVRLCGDKLNDGRVLEDFTQNSPVTDFGNGPTILQVRTNSVVVGRGFKLVYYQEPCK